MALFTWILNFAHLLRLSRGTQAGRLSLVAAGGGAAAGALYTTGFPLGINLVWLAVLVPVGSWSFGHALLIMQHGSEWRRAWVAAGWTAAGLLLELGPTPWWIGQHPRILWGAILALGGLWWLSAFTVASRLAAVSWLTACLCLISGRGATSYGAAVAAALTWGTVSPHFLAEWADLARWQRAAWCSLMAAVLALALG